MKIKYTGRADEPWVWAICAAMTTMADEARTEFMAKHHASDGEMDVCFTANGVELDARHVFKRLFEVRGEAIKEAASEVVKERLAKIDELTENLRERLEEVMEGWLRDVASKQS